jgi:RND family efflux transporter MFP subunit
MRRFLILLFFIILNLEATQIYVTFNVEAKQTASLAFYTGGIIDKIYVDISSKVKKGDKLIELKNDDLKAALRVAKANYQNAKVTLKYAKKDYQRQLKIKDLIDEAKFDKYALSYEQAKVLLAKAKANVAYQSSLLDRTVIKAPFDGVIFSKTAEVGDVVSGMMLRTIMKIQSIDDRKLILEFDQKYWNMVKVGADVSYSVNGDKKVYHAKISRLYPHANIDNRKIKAEVKTKGFIVGLFGDGHILIKDEK